MPVLINRFLRFLVLSALTLAAAVAFALPAPKDIEQAVQAGNYTQAETLLREVLREKPDSAKAHYELGQVLARQSRPSEAHAALVRAKEIDPALKFTNQPEKFKDLLERTSGSAGTVSSGVQAKPMAQMPASSASSAAAPASAGTGGSIPLTYIWIALIGVGIIGVLMFRRARDSAQSVQPGYNLAPANLGGSMGSAPFGNGPRGMPMGGPGYGAYPAPGANSGPGAMTGAVVGGLAGVAAGYALSKALEGNDHESAARSSSASESNHFQPLAPTPSEDYGSFDAGSGDGWDNSGGDSGGGDDW